MFLPSVIENSGRREHVIDLPSRLLKDRIIQLNGEITDMTAYSIVQQLLYLDAIEEKDISLYINSPGGSVYAGLAIYDVMNSTKSKVSTVGIGLCASMGTFLLGAGDNRFALPNTSIMIHSISGGTSGTIHDMKIDTDHSVALNEQVMKLLWGHTDGKIEYQKFLEKSERDYWLTPEQAQEIGIIDEIKGIR